MRWQAVALLPSPLRAGLSHVDFFDSNLSPKAFGRFQNCASETIWIRSLRKQTKKKRHALAGRGRGGGN